MSIKVIQLNMLAPLWVDEQYKQFPCYTDIVSPTRVSKTLEYLQSFDVDVYVLCEVEQLSLKQIKKHFGKHYTVTFTSNKIGFWSEYLKGKKWVENGTCIIIKKKNATKVQTSAIDLGDGCMVTVAEMMWEGSVVAVIAVHFDTGPRKYFEVDTLLQELKRFDNGDVCIVSGDFNMISTQEFNDRGYVGTVLCQEHTTILLEGVIDHTIVKGAKRIRSTVLRAPITKCSSMTSGIAGRLCGNPSGSDHYATLSTIYL